MHEQSSVTPNRDSPSWVQLLKPAITSTATMHASVMLVFRVPILLGRLVSATNAAKVFPTIPQAQNV